MTQPIDSTKNFVTLKVPRETRKAVKDLANAIDQGISETAAIVIKEGLAKIADAKQYPACSDSGTPIDIGESPIYRGQTVNVLVPLQIAPWVPKLVTVLSGPARHALESNLDTFVEYTELKAVGNEPPPGNPVEVAEKALAALGSAKDASEEHLGRGNRRTGKRSKTA
jgi:hypothetical protein